MFDYSPNQIDYTFFWCSANMLLWATKPPVSPVPLRRTPPACDSAAVFDPKD
jgi:hypothetical protein